MFKHISEEIDKRSAERRKRNIKRGKEKNEYLANIQEIRSEKNNIKEKKIKRRRWFNFFTTSFFIGIISIVLSVLITALWNIEKEEILVIRSTISGTLSTIGIALMLGAIFDFSKNSEAFVQFISGILYDIVVSKTFLTALSDNDKERALELILKPTDKQIERYSNINELYEKKLRDLMTMFDANFKTNVTLNVKVYKEENVVKSKTVLTNVVYKIGNSFEAIQVLFEKEDSCVQNFLMLPPCGQGETVEPSEEIFVSGGIKYKKLTYEVPPKFQKFDHLKIVRTMIESGHEHWTNFYWQSLSPYEGLSCQIRCEDGLTIKDHMIFDNKADYHVEKSKDSKQIDIISSQWLDTDTGFVVTIGEPAGPQSAGKCIKWRN